MPGILPGLFPSVATVVGGVASIIMGLVTILIKLASLLVALSLWLNSTLTTLDWNGMNAFILQGWSMFRDLANLGFVFGIILIAFATIFRWKNYSASQILWKLVVAALLVNFSLVIISPFLVVSQNFSDYYLNKVAGGTGSGGGSAGQMALLAAQKTVSSLNPLMYNNPNTSAWDKIKQYFSSNSAQDISNVISQLIGIFIQVVIFMTLLGFAVVLIIRYFFVAFLMILAPMVWLLWIFPATQKHWKSWWSHFIKWMIYPPAVLFFLNLAMQLYLATNGANGQPADPGLTSFINTLTTGGGDVVSQIPFSAIVGSLMSVAMIIGGMMVASSIGVKGGEMATNAAGNAKDWAVGLGKKKAGDWSSRGGSRLMQTKVGQSVVGGTGRILGKVPIIGDTLHQKVIEGQQAVEKRANRQTEDAKTRFARYSDQQLRAAWKSGDARDRAAMLDLLASKDKLGLLDDLATHQDYLKAYGTLRQGGNGKAVGDIAKKRGMSEDMMVLATGGKVYEKDRDGRVKTDAGGKPIEVTYQSAAEKFYGSLDRKDWTSLAKTSGGALLKGESVLGFDKSQAELIRKHYVKNILGDETGKAVSGTAPGLKDSKSLEVFYQTMLDETAEEANQLSKDPTWSQLMTEAIEKSEGNREELIDRIQAGMTILPDSVSHADRARLERRLKRLKHSMTSALGGFHESGDEAKDEKKGADDKEKKSEGKK